jgi:alpha-mannosidase
MDRYPAFKFGASSPQQYMWLEELYPELFQRLTAAVKKGSFIPLGMAWIEHDCILPSGVSNEPPHISSFVH